MYQSQPSEKRFAEGATIALGEADLPMRAVKGKVQIQVEPAGVAATITIQHEGGAEQAIRPGTHFRDAGDYVVSASAAGYEKSQVGRRVTLGQTTFFHLELRGEAAGVSRRHLGLADLAKIQGFESVDGVLVRNGGEFALLPLSPATGSYTFTANMRGGGVFGIGKPRIQWIVDYADDGNYALYEFGENALSRTLVSGGKRGSTDRVPHSCPKADYYSLSVEVSPGAVVHKALCDGQWVVLETWQSDGANLADGKFGFFVPNRSTLAISHFEAVGP
jgi:hypothetical protein